MRVDPITRSLEAELNNQYQRQQNQTKRAKALDARAKETGFDSYLAAATDHWQRALDAARQVTTLENAIQERTTDPCPNEDCEEGKVPCECSDRGGSVDCSACSGTGIATSGPVEGSCHYCRGSGEAICTECEDGWVDCQTCGGTGRVPKKGGA